MTFLESSTISQQPSCKDIYVEVSGTYFLVNVLSQLCKLDLTGSSLYAHNTAVFQQNSVSNPMHG